MLIEVRKQRKVTVFELQGKLTIGFAEETVRERFKELLDRGERRIVIDMTRVPYLDSAGVGVLVQCAKRAYENGGIVKIVAPPGAVRELLRVACLDRVFEVHAGKSDAITSF